MLCNILYYKILSTRRLGSSLSVGQILKMVFDGVQVQVHSRNLLVPGRGLCTQNARWVALLLRPSRQTRDIDTRDAMFWVLDAVWIMSFAAHSGVRP